MSKVQKIIAIDGPAGSGKSTTARAVAKALGWQYLDTGAMYRALALAVDRAGNSMDDEKAVLKVFDHTEITFGGGFPPAVLLNGEDVSEAIRSPEMSQGSSRVSVHPSVRKRMVQLQRKLGLMRPSVLEGRDTTTKIFPDAGLKIYLDGSPEIRTRRRLLDYEKQGRTISFEEVVADIHERDQRDSNRSEGPLSVAEGAVVLDTDPWTLEQQIDEVLKVAREQFGTGEGA
ncbi:MAG: (d)CMP kinase [bacterium]